MSSPVSRVHPLACGESIGGGLYPAPVFFLLFTGKYREAASPQAAVDTAYDSFSEGDAGSAGRCQRGIGQRCKKTPSV
jgi:hypothetical protein